MHHLNSAYRRVPLIFVVLALFSLALLAVGCGGHSTTTAAVVNPTPTPTPTATPAPASTIAQIRFGDDPVDSILAFEVSIESVAVTAESGEKTALELPSKTNRLELSHMASKFEPFMNLSVPQGSYTAIELTLVDPAVTYVKTQVLKGDFILPSHGELVSQDFPGSQVVTLTFDSPLVVAADPAVFNLDFNIAKTLVLNPDTHEITGIDFATTNPFSLVVKPIGASDAQQHQNGELEDVVGTVTSVNGTSFVLQDGQSGAVLAPVNITDTTKIHDSLDNVAVLSDALGRVVEVEGFTAADGSFMANEIELLAGKTGASIEGVVLDAANSFNERNFFDLGHQNNSFSLLTQDGTGNGSQIADVGWTFTIHTQYLNELSYQVDYGKCDWSAITPQIEDTFFRFDAQHIFPGQRVMVQTSSTLPDGDFTHFTGTGVELAQQAVTGTIVKYHKPSDSVAAGPTNPFSDATWFLLALPSDSFVAALSGSNLVFVYQPAGTDLELLSTNTDQTIGEDSVVRVRGLMFMPFNDRIFSSAVSDTSHSGPFLTMVARRITEQQSAPPCGASSLTPCQ